MEELIKKYWQGLLTEEQKKELLDRLTEEEIKFLKANDKGFPDKEENMSVSNREEEKFERLLSVLHNNFYKDEQLRKKQSRKQNNKYWLWAAAALLIFVSSIGYWFAAKKGHDEIAMTSLSRMTEKGKVLKINNADTSLYFSLPDSSIVELGSHSSIEYDEYYNVEKRYILLNKGYARFKVAKNPKKPFLVVAEGLITTAIGTEFCVNAYEKDNIVVRLFHGKISVHGKLNSGKEVSMTYLSPGEALNVNTNSGVPTLNKPGEVIGKRQPQKRHNTLPDSGFDKLEFKKASLGAVFTKMMRFYKVTIKYKQDDVKGLWFTGSFDSSNSIDKTLSTICNVNNLTYHKDGTDIIIQSN